MVNNIEDKNLKLIWKNNRLEIGRNDTLHTSIIVQLVTKESLWRAHHILKNIFLHY